MNFTGYLKLNNADVWTQYGAFLCELSAAEHINMDELKKMPKLKAYTTVNYRERNGEELPEKLPSPCYEAIDRTLQFCIPGDSIADREAKYHTFMDDLKKGWLLLEVKGMRRYKMHLQEQSSLIWYDDRNKPSCVFKIKLREPKPGEV